MSVEAGFGGQAFNPVALERLNQVRRESESKVLLEVDGGAKRYHVGSMPAGWCRPAGRRIGDFSRNRLLSGNHKPASIDAGCEDSSLKAGSFSIFWSLEYFQYGSDCIDSPWLYRL